MRYHSPTVRMAKIQNAGEGKQQQELSFIARGITTLEDRLAVSYKHTLTIQSNNHTPFKTYCT